MKAPIECPPDEDLWPLAFDEPCDEGLRGHADACDHCRGRIARLRAEVAAVRDLVRDRGDTNAPQPTTGGDRGSPDPDASTATFHEPTRPAMIGRYTVIGVLDEGGQAVVYRVVHRELLKELVLKRARKPPLGPVDRDAMVAEGRLLVGLDHPALVRIYDLDFDEGRPYLVMEYVPGMNLAQWAGQARPSPREAARVVAQLARATGVAHRRGVVHHDIKPKNALIDPQGRPRLIDFGMAHLRDAWSPGDDGPRGGTVAFMAPEQAQGGWDRVGPAADIFALGAVLYFLLTGEAPYRGQSFGEVMQRARKCEFDLEPLQAPGIPSRLRQICLKAMAAEPADRPPSAEKLAGELERFARPSKGPWIALAASLLLVVAVVRPLLPGPPAMPKVDPPPSTTADTLIGSLQVDLTRPGSVEPLGRVGLSAFAARFDDNARVAARLAVPAYCYLIALNPDGREQLCLPADPSKAPVQSDLVDFPPDPEDVFGLNDGVGLQAFVLVASRTPLPPYARWRAGLGSLPWRPTTAETTWRHDGRRFLPSDGQEMGTIRPQSGLPQPLVETCRVFRQAPGIEAIRAIAFPIKPKAEPPGPAKFPAPNR